VKRLAGGIPRALPNHRTPEGFRYGTYCRAKLRRLGSLPADALPTLRQAGLLMLELERLPLEAAELRGPKKRRERMRLRRQLVILRSQFLTLERRLEELAKGNGHGGDPSTLLRESS